MFNAVVITFQFVKTILVKCNSYIFPKTSLFVPLKLLYLSPGPLSFTPPPGSPAPSIHSLVQLHSYSESLHLSLGTLAFRPRNPSIFPARTPSIHPQDTNIPTPGALSLICSDTFHSAPGTLAFLHQEPSLSSARKPSIYPQVRKLAFLHQEPSLSSARKPSIHPQEHWHS